EVGKIEHGISIEHSNNTHIAEIEPFCHHLRANEYVGPATFKIFYDLAVGIFAACTVEFHTRNFCFRKQYPYILFYFFCTQAFEMQLITSASRTYRWRSHRISAVVAQNFLQLFVVDQRNIALHAMWHMS